MLFNGPQMAEILNFYQIYYRDDQKQEIFPFSIPHFNEKLTVFFENSIISSLVKQSEAEKIAVCSWKLRQKLRIRVAPRTPLTEEALKSYFQVLSMTRNSPNHKMIARATLWHKGFRPAIEMLWRKLGYKMPHETRNPIYFNHYCAKAEVYKDYVNNFLDPAMKLIETDEELKPLMWADSNYQKLARDADIKQLEQIGLSYYPMIPFVLERCPSLWFSMKKIKVDYL